MRLAINHLRYIISTMPQMEDSTPAWRAYGLGCAVIREFLGIEWLERHVLNFEAPTNFFRNGWTEIVHYDEMISRTIDLGESLYNLQNTINFESCLARLRQTKEQVESNFCEIEVAKLLRIQGIHFEFVKEKQLLGCDYDINIKLRKYPTLYCETKCKLETTQLSKSTIKSSLETARTQLPPGGPGIVFLKVPQGWLTPDHKDSLDAINIVLDVVNSFLRNTTRVTSVVVYANVHESIQGGLLRRYMVNQVLSPRQDVPTPIVFFKDTQPDILIRTWTRFLPLCS